MSTTKKTTTTKTTAAAAATRSSSSSSSSSTSTSASSKPAKSAKPAKPARTVSPQHEPNAEAVAAVLPELLADDAYLTENELQLMFRTMQLPDDAPLRTLIADLYEHDRIVRSHVRRLEVEDTPRELDVDLIRERAIQAQQVQPAALDQSLDPLFALHVLFLDRLHLTSYATCLASFRNVTHLYLQRNRLTTIEALRGMPNLEFLVLSDNLIEDVAHVNEFESLRFLDLSRNRIDDFDPDELPEYVEAISFSGNACTEHPQYRHHVLACCPYLELLDGELVTTDMRRELGLEVSDSGDEGEEDDDDDDDDDEDGDDDELRADRSVAMGEIAGDGNGGDGGNARTQLTLAQRREAEAKALKELVDGIRAQALHDAPASARASATSSDSVEARDALRGTVEEIQSRANARTQETADSAHDRELQEAIARSGTLPEEFLAKSPALKLDWLRQYAQKP